MNDILTENSADILESNDSKDESKQKKRTGRASISSQMDREKSAEDIVNAPLSDIESILEKDDEKV